MKVFYLAIIGAGVIGYGAVDAVNLLSPTSALSGACNIKGNISIKSRERIYHVLGQEFYEETKISPSPVRRTVVLLRG